MTLEAKEPSQFFVEIDPSPYMEEVEQFTFGPHHSIDDMPVGEIRIAIADQLSYHGHRFLRITEQDQMIVIELLIDENCIIPPIIIDPGELVDLKGERSGAETTY